MITSEYSLDDLLDTKARLSMPLQTEIARECGVFILADDLLQTYHPEAKKMAMHLLKSDDERISITPASLEKGIQFIEKILSEAKKSSSRYALELRACLNVKNFKKFAQQFLEQKLGEV